MMRTVKRNWKHDSTAAGSVQRGVAASWSPRLWLVLALSVSVAGVSIASTIHVNRDGSGDYEALQPAIDVAAAGDTILIGPGRYDQYIQYPSPFDTLDAIARVSISNLTFRGTGRDEVIVGPEVRPVSSAYRGLVCFFLEPATGLCLESMTIENALAGVSTDAELQLRDVVLRGHEIEGAGNTSQYPLVVENCLIEDNYIGLLLRAGDVGTTIRNTTFINNSDRAIDGAVGANFEVRDCSFTVSGIVSFAMVLDRTAHANVVHCQFIAGDSFANFISIGNRSSAEIRFCHFDPCRGTIGVGSTSSFSGSDNVLEGGSLATILIEDRSTATFSGNDIRHLSGPSILIDSYYTVAGPGSLDFRDNYWGTDNADSIAAWIHDAQDDPTLAPTVLFEPFRTQSVPVKKASVGGLKAQFGGR